MTPDYMKRIWLAEAPPGVWNSGPAVLYDLNIEEAIKEYTDMGWEITGPYILAEENT